MLRINNIGGVEGWQRKKSVAAKPAIVIRDLSKVFIIGKEKVKALAGVNLDIYQNEIVCLLGNLRFR